MFSLSVGAKAVSNNLRQTLSGIMATVHAHLCISFEYKKHIRSMQSAYIVITCDLRNMRGTYITHMIHRIEPTLRPAEPDDGDFVGSGTAQLDLLVKIKV